nr:reverse transcriptase domain-containing protein [Tanacetum cinerariifolium]
MAPRRTTRSTVDQETVNTTTVTNAQLQTMIDQGVTAALAARDALRSTNGNDSHDSGTGVRRTERAARECTYTDFLKCQHYLSKEPRELPVFCNGVKEWSLSFTSATALLKTKSSLLHALFTLMFSEESDKIEKYVGGLLDMIHGSVVASKPKTMQEAIEIATELMDKKNTGRVYTATSGRKKQYGGSKPLCAKCNYHYDGPCAPKCHNCNKIGHSASDYRSVANTNNTNNQRGTELGQKPTCYECGVRGHFRRECPKLKNNNNHGKQGRRNNAPVRVYPVGHAGTDPDANVVTGTFLLNNRYASILFDTGVDRSFVSTTFSTQINITPSTLDHCYDVELADGRMIGLNTILRSCTLNLLNHPFNIDLMPVELGRAGTDPDANVVTGTFLLNNRYAYILFDTGADRSFVSTTFSTQINIMPSTLDHCYDVELADGRMIGLNTILRSCTLNLLNHPFNIDLMPVELGSFDAIIGMDWLAKYQAVIVCAEKIVRIPWGDETLITHGDGSNRGNVTRLSIISCTKTEKYVKKGFHIFLAHITTKEVEDKSEKKRLEDVPIV